jgi:hypothetical protein
MSEACHARPKNLRPRCVRCSFENSRNRDQTALALRAKTRYHASDLVGGGPNLMDGFILK